MLTLWGSGVAAQAYRYRRVSGPVERQQAKWVMFTLGSFRAIIASGIVIPSLFLDLPDVWFAAVLLASVPGEVDLDALSNELLGVVDQTMRPTTASLWLRPAAQARPRGR